MDGWIYRWTGWIYGYSNKTPDWLVVIKKVKVFSQVWPWIHYSQHIKSTPNVYQMHDKNLWDRSPPKKDAHISTFTSLFQRTPHKVSNLSYADTTTEISSVWSSPPCGIGEWKHQDTRIIKFCQLSTAKCRVLFSEPSSLWLKKMGKESDIPGTLNGGPCFVWKRPCFLGVTFKNRGQLGSGYIILCN